MRKTINVKDFVFLSYVILPALFYFFPYVISMEEGFIRMYFFNAFDIPHEIFSRLFFGYLIFGFLVYKTLSVTGFEIVYEENSTTSMNVFIIIFFLAFMYTPISYLKLLLTPLFYIFISSYRPRNITFFVLLSISLINMVIFYDRYPVILVLMIWMLPFLSRLNIWKLFLVAFVGVIFLIFILQPLRAGLLPFSSGFGDVSYFFKHLFPVYIGAFLLYTEDFSFLQLMSESVPFMKSVLGYESVIEIIAVKGLPSDIIQSGTRHGSNTSMYFDGYGPFILIGLLSSLYMAIHFFKLQRLKNTILLIFVLQGPYFLRRTFGSLYIDIIVAIFVCVLISLFVQVSNKGKSYE
ncbi:hypothetical protein BCU13_013105 [Vibrio lentus]|uniref:hypothetical protein n=1 Tax=Vibrio lentus TaxID=136468 RepID=UPI000C816993|nr:hypothetical protein [Vibrio lentus]PMJ85342.1 hypothetical protein BCU13_14645 [Vibrio lentus]